MSSSNEQQYTIGSTNAKTLKNRKYRKLQKAKKDATKKDQAEKLLKLNNDMYENAEKIKQLSKEGVAKDIRW